MKNLILKYSLGMYAGLVGYFFMMRFFGMYEVVELRLFNLFIVIAGLYLLLKENMDHGYKGYLHNIFLGFKTISITMILIAISLLVYLQFINPGFKAFLADAMLWGRNLSMAQIALAITIEGISSGFIITFMAMQYLKDYAGKKSHAHS